MRQEIKFTAPTMNADKLTVLIDAECKAICDYTQRNWDIATEGSFADLVTFFLERGYGMGLVVGETKIIQPVIDGLNRFAEGCHEVTEGTVDYYFYFTRKHVLHSELLSGRQDKWKLHASPHETQDKIYHGNTTNSYLLVGGFDFVDAVAGEGFSHDRTQQRDIEESLMMAIFRQGESIALDFIEQRYGIREFSESYHFEMIRKLNDHFTAPQ